MKRLFLLLLPLMGTLSAAAWSGDVSIETPNTMLILHAGEGQDLRMAYYGPRVTSLQELCDAGADLNSSALPAFGTVDMVQLPALQVLHADGDLNLELKVEDYEVKAESASKTHTFTMQDKLQPVTVKMFYKAYDRVDIIETWTEIVNAEKKAITLKRYDSGHLVLRQGNVWITHMHGNWAAGSSLSSSAAMLPCPGVSALNCSLRI
jgi:alpha-galactosidase